MSDDDLPVVDPPDDAGAPGGTGDASAGPVDVAGVLLAAGRGDRFEGGDKLLADLAGEPVVRRSGRALSAAGLEPLVGVVRPESGGVRAELAGLGFETVEAPGRGEGIAASLRRGLRAVRGDAAAVVVGLGDLPVVAPASVRALVDTYRSGTWTALAAAHDGVRGNPVLFDAAHLPDLLALEGDAGGRSVLLAAEDAALVETGDPGVLADVDTRADLRRARERLE